jgi:hypothetical protein
MPRGRIVHGSSTALTGVTMTAKKAMFAGQTATVSGGVTWDAANAAFTGPPGTYLVQVRAHAYPSSVDGAIEVGTGRTDTGAAYSSALTGGMMIKGMESFHAGSGYREVDAGFKLTMWCRSSSTRNMGFFTFSVHYLGH